MTQPLTNSKPSDPYKTDSSFKPSRKYMKKYLSSIESVKGSSEQKFEKIVRILDESGKKSEVIIPAIGPAKAKILQRIVRRHKLKNIYEIGTLFGYSAIVIAKSMPTDGVLTTIQKSSRNMAIANRIIKAAGFSKKIRLMIGDATKNVPPFKNKLDMIFIDGYKPEYLQYLKKAEPQLRIGGLVVADNVLLMGDEMKDYLDYVRNSGNYKSKTIKTLRGFTRTEDAIEVSIKIK